ncbi:hypothetical protein CspHIS471_0301990 [Cutaneotrichosporon sp. HIS471]|nr:hypothetical protein CspHIS471_0301990 [Cutaneotrichosporon sp. HIS471]
MPPREAWSAAHDEALLRAMAVLLLANRRALYATPGLEGVADHGGERINKKIQAFARRMAADQASIVTEELGKLGRKRKEEDRVKEKVDEDEVKKEPGVEKKVRKKRKL